MQYIGRAAAIEGHGSADRDALGGSCVGYGRRALGSHSDRARQAVPVTIVDDELGGIGAGLVYRKARAHGGRLMQRRDASLRDRHQGPLIGESVAIDVGRAAAIERDS